jgi:hypothetical protein
MADVLKESAWQPVKLGNSAGYKVNSYAVSSSWYNQSIENNGSRQTRLRRYHEADVSSIQIGRALDIMAEDVSSCNADQEEVFSLDYPDEDKMKKSTLSIMSGMLDVWKTRTEMEQKFYDRVRKTLKYGATFYREQSDGTLKELYTERMVGYVLSPEDDTEVTHYVYDPNGALIEDVHNRNYRKQLGNANSETRYETIPISDLVIFKIGEKPFGESVIERVYSTWRKLAMLEDSIVIYRVVRAPERRIYYVDTGNLQGKRREAAIEKQRLRLMQKQSSRSGDLSSEYDPHSTSEDIFIPTNSQGKGSRVETLPAGQALGETRDLQWFHRELAAGLRIPFSMIDTQSGENDREQYSDMRVGQVYQVEIRYMGYVNRLAAYFKRPCSENFSKFCLVRDIVPPEGTEFKINQPNSFSLYKELETNQMLLNVAASTQSMPSISKRYVMQKYMNMDHEEMAENEIDKLHELGISDELIKTMLPNEVANLVYAAQPNPAIAEKYGISKEGGGFGGF